MSVSKALSQHITSVVLLKGKTSFQLPLISSYIKVINLVNWEAFSTTY
jgi:hypothetical protein